MGGENKVHGDIDVTRVHKISTNVSREISKSWAQTHDNELPTTSTAKHRLNDGSAWMRKVCSVIWEHVHQMGLKRNLGRHGREEKDGSERARQGCLKRNSHVAQT